MSDVCMEYTKRHAARKMRAEACQALTDRIADLRLGVFALGVILLAGVYFVGELPPIVLVVPVAMFVALVVWHERVHRRRAQAELAVQHYARGLDRLRGTWVGTGDEGERFQPDHHPFAADLDLFGEGSMFELLCTARTQVGARTLADWLLHPATPETVRLRHGAVAELRANLDLREQLGVLGADFDAGVRPDALAAWSQAAADLVVRPGRRWFHGALTLAGLGSIVVSVAVGVLAPAVLVLIVCLVAHAPYRSALPRLGASVSTASRELNMLAQVLRVLEETQFEAPYLCALQERLKSGGTTASQAIARLDRLVTLYDLQRNQIFIPFAVLGLWGIHVGTAIERWRARYRAAVCEDWLPAVGELEALCAVSGYAYEHPSDVLPEYVAGAPALRLVGGGHALLPEANCVRNDVVLAGETRLLMVSGSNMSGKSTLLRTVGLNVVLAQAGVPVRATAMTLTPLSLGATLRVQDSIQEGASRFYAEIRRFRTILDIAEKGPTLFLADEILHGTNSHDRCVGAEGLLRALLAREAIGMITTHDLAITALAEGLGGALNVHLQDHLEDGKLAFDYLVRPGVVEKSNALELMRQIGLPV